MFFTYIEKLWVKTYNLCPKSHLEIPTKLQQSYYRIKMISRNIMKNFSFSQKCNLHKMAEFENTVGFPVMCHLVHGKFT